MTPDELLQVPRVLGAKIDRLPPDHPAVRMRTLFQTAPKNGGAASEPQSPDLEDDDYWLKEPDEPENLGSGSPRTNDPPTVRLLVPAPPSTPRVRWHLLTDKELLEQPEPAWLLKDVLFAGGLTLLYGMKGTFKSFVALAWALAIGTGQPWLGRSVTQGLVVYIVAEGAGLFRRPLAA